MSTIPDADIIPQRLLHTMIRVSKLERSVAFYRDALGLRELRREDYPDDRFTLSFLGYGDEDETSVLELTYNYDVADYSLGDGFGHIAVAVTNLFAACERLAAMGVKIIRAPGPMKSANANGQRDVIAFIEDPDGYQIELIQSRQRSR
jgi:lactoylglutathione lyase